MHSSMRVLVVKEASTQAYDDGDAQKDDCYAYAAITESVIKMAK